MNNLIDEYIEKKKLGKIEEIIDEVADIFEYGELDHDNCVNLCKLLIDDVIEIHETMIEESMLNAISNAVIYKDVAEEIDWDILVSEVNKFDIMNLEYIFIALGFSHNEKYISILYKYVDNIAKTISENAKLAIKEIEYFNKNNK